MNSKNVLKGIFVATSVLVLSGCNKSTTVDDIEATASAAPVETSDVYANYNETSNLNEANMLDVLTDELDESSPFYEMVNSFMENNEGYKVLPSDEIKSFYNFDDTYAKDSIGLISFEGNINRVYMFRNAKQSTVYNLINIAYNEAIQVYDVVDCQYTIINVDPEEDGVIKGITVVLIGETDWIEANTSYFQEGSDASKLIDYGDIDIEDQYDVVIEENGDEQAESDVVEEQPVETEETDN